MKTSAKSKVCGKCNRRRAKDLFYRSAAALDGLQPWCKRCCKIARVSAGKITRAPKNTAPIADGSRAKLAIAIGEIYRIMSCLEIGELVIDARNKQFRFKAWADAAIE